jgi:hypothetical protein
VPGAVFRQRPSEAGAAVNSQIVKFFEIASTKNEACRNCSACRSLRVWISGTPKNRDSSGKASPSPASLSHERGHRYAGRCQPANGADAKKPRWGEPGFRTGRSGQGKTRYAVLTLERHGNWCGSASSAPRDALEGASIARTDEPATGCLLRRLPNVDLAIHFRRHVRIMA